MVYTTFFVQPKICNYSKTNKQIYFTVNKYIQGVSEIRVLILTSGRTRQFMTLFSITFCKIRKIF
jgi:hypothetical protein